MSLKSKLGMFQSEKNRFDEMANHIKVSEITKAEEFCHFYLSTEMCLFSGSDCTDRENHQGRVSETLPFPSERGD